VTPGPPVPGARRPLPWLAPLGRLWLAAARGRGWLYDAGILRSEHPGVPVVSVGNLVAGGTGKTPLVAWLAEGLADRGLRVGVVSRGHGGKRPVEPLLVGRDGELLVEPDLSGDEPTLLADRPGVHLVVVGKDRRAAARVAAREGAQVILLDDGFQHRRLARDLDLVLLDWADPLGGGRGLPAGWLREPPSALARADVLVLTRAPRDVASRREPLPARELPPALATVLAGLPASPPVLAAAHVPTGVRLPGGRWRPASWLAGHRVLPVAGIARPESFLLVLRELGALPADPLCWPDHHRFREADARRIRDAATAGGLEVITTAKDALRWPPGAPDPLVLEIGIHLGAGTHLLDRVLRLVRGGRPT